MKNLNKLYEQKYQHNLIKKTLKKKQQSKENSQQDSFSKSIFQEKISQQQKNLKFCNSILNNARQFRNSKIDQLVDQNTLESILKKQLNKSHRIQDRKSSSQKLKKKNNSKKFQSSIKICKTRKNKSELNLRKKSQSEKKIRREKTEQKNNQLKRSLFFPSNNSNQQPILNSNKKQKNFSFSRKKKISLSQKIKNIKKNRQSLNLAQTSKGLFKHKFSPHNNTHQNNQKNQIKKFDNPDDIINLIKQEIQIYNDFLQKDKEKIKVLKDVRNTFKNNTPLKSSKKIFTNDLIEKKLHNPKNFSVTKYKNKNLKILFN